MNILFLGNSLIFYNELPLVFDNLLKSAGISANVQSVTKGSATVSDFTDETTIVGGKALPLLKEQAWDYVIIEPSRRISPFENSVKEAELASAKTIRELALSAGGDVVLYSVWGNNHGKAHEFHAETPIRMPKIATHPIERKAHTAFMQRINTEFAAELQGVKVAEAGFAFENLIATYPHINPYHEDNRHPCLAGTYLVACVLYATIFEKSVKDIPYTAELPFVNELKEIADATVLGGLVPDLS